MRQSTTTACRQMVWLAALASAAAAAAAAASPPHSPYPLRSAVHHPLQHTAAISARLRTPPAAAVRLPPTLRGALRIGGARSIRGPAVFQGAAAIDGTTLRLRKR
jgi:hypothetical protein